LSTLPQSAPPTTGDSATKGAPADTPKIKIRRKVTTHTLAKKLERNEPITMLTAYDFPTAAAVDTAGVDMILVGDSLAMVVLGHEDTLSVTMDEMLHHARAVKRGAKHALLVGDMPFMSYQVSTEEAVRNAGRFIQDAGMDAVKLEGGREFAHVAKAIVRAGIPVQGHIGLTPQSVNVLGGWRVQGKTADAAMALLHDALALQEAGCFSIVLESVPSRIAKIITERLDIPTIGIGAGVDCSGQVLVIHDLVGLFEGFKPKFVKRYAHLAEPMRQAVGEYLNEVKTGAFPTQEYGYDLPDEEFDAFEQQLKERDAGPKRGRRPMPAGGRRIA
jgi:3-methyl-2-oxobutanoate hydroxymethyltransferase